MEKTVSYNYSVFGGENNSFNLQFEIGGDLLKIGNELDDDEDSNNNLKDGTKIDGIKPANENKR